MNLTENELRALSLEEQQKIVIELADVRPGDRAYPNAKAITEFITGLKKYKAPEKIKVVALHDVPVDGRDVKKDQEVEVYPWQYRALARFFELVKKPGAAAAVLMLLALFMCGLAQAQQYTIPYLAGLNGGTNAIAGNTTNLLWTPVITTNTTISPVITISNGVTVTTFTTNSTFTTNIAGMLNSTRSRYVGVQASFAGGPGTSTNIVTIPFYACLDGSTNAWQIGTLTGTASNTSTVTVGTNWDLGAAGYLIGWSYGNAGTNYLTNLVLRASQKQSLTGL